MSKPGCTYSSRCLISSHSVPLLPGRRDFDMREHKAAVELLTMQSEFEVALLEHLVGVAAHRLPCAHVPNHDSPAP